MQISSTTNQYQTLQMQQQPITTPVEPQPEKYSNIDVYDASKGNLIVGKDETLTLTPQGQNNLNNSKEESETQEAAAQQAEKDAARDSATDLLNANSKKSQVEIYLAVATDGEVDSNSATVDVINNLREVQKQNNTVQAYATYKESEQTPVTTFF